MQQSLIVLYRSTLKKTYIIGKFSVRFLLDVAAKFDPSVDWGPSLNVCLVLQGISVIMVAQNSFELLIGVRTLPVGTKVRRTQQIPSVESI